MALSKHGPKTPKIIIDKIRSLSQEEGLKDSEIAEIIGMQRVSVCRIRARYDIPAKDLSNRKDIEARCINCGNIFYKRRKDRNKEEFLCPHCKQMIEEIALKEHEESLRKMKSGDDTCGCQATKSQN